MTLREIAIKMHAAEEVEDDISFLEAQDELEAIKRLVPNSAFTVEREFHIIYRQVWRERMGDAPVPPEHLDPVRPWGTNA